MSTTYTPFPPEPPRPDKKRKLSSKPSEPGRVPKHRSSQACHACRLRKVRCDVLSNGGPKCTNCRLDDTECVVLASRRGKNNRTRLISLPQPALEPQNPSPDEPILQPSIDKRTSPPSEDVPVCVTFDEVDDAAGEGDHGGLPTPDHCPLTSPDPSTASFIHAAPDFAALPPFIAPLPPHLDRDAIAFLALKGAFTIPERALRVKIAQSYVASIHAFMPIVDLQVLSRCVCEEQHDSGMGILLFQAVMFAGLAAVDVEDGDVALGGMGFASVRVARERFFDRVRWLYEFEVEQREEQVLMALLLMSWWYGSPKQRRHTWHWTGLAYSLALNMGLHREPTVPTHSSASRHSRRRLWWSLYIRDRLLALGTRRPMRIQDDAFSVTMLTLSDLDTAIPSPLLSAYFPDPDDYTATAHLCIAAAQLAILIGHVLASQYTTLETSPNVPPGMMVLPQRPSPTSTTALATCAAELSAWHASFTALPSSPCLPSSIHRSLLHILHLTLVNVLHRPHALSPSQPSPSDTSPDQSSSSTTITTTTTTTPNSSPSPRSTLKSSARSVTSLSLSLAHRSHIRICGVPLITALIAAALAHVLDMRSADADVRDAGRLRFGQTVGVLRKLGEVFAAADAGVGFLGGVVTRLDKRGGGGGVGAEEMVPEVQVGGLGLEGQGQGQGRGQGQGQGQGRVPVLDGMSWGFDVDVDGGAWAGSEAVGGLYGEWGGSGLFADGVGTYEGEFWAGGYGFYGQ